MKRKVVHSLSIRMLNNAGIMFPVCYSNAESLDMDKSRLEIVATLDRVTCKRCLAVKRVHPWR